MQNVLAILSEMLVWPVYYIWKSHIPFRMSLSMCCCMGACAGCPPSLCFSFSVNQHMHWVLSAVVIDDLAVYCHWLQASRNRKVLRFGVFRLGLLQKWWFCRLLFLVSWLKPSYNASRTVIDHAQRRVSAWESACSWQTMACIVRLKERKSCRLWYVTEQQMNEWMKRVFVYVVRENMNKKAI